MNDAQAQKEIAALIKTIDHHNDLYYQENRTEISDLEFDSLLAKLIALEEQFPHLKSSDSPTQRVGGTITKSLQRFIISTPCFRLAIRIVSRSWKILMHVLERAWMVIRTSTFVS